MSDLSKKVRARADAIERAITTTEQPKREGMDPELVLDCLRRNRVGDADLFRTLFPNKYAYVEEWERWLGWTGHHWEDGHKRSALADISHVCDLYESVVMAQDPIPPTLRRLLDSRLKILRDRTGRENLLECLTSIDNPPVISAEDLDQQHYLLATPTGVVDLRTGDCSPGRPDQYVLNPCDTPWIGLDTPCPTFDQYLLTCMDGDAEMAEFLVRLLGYGLLGEKHLHVWAIFYGPLSRNGKDTLMNIVKAILGKRLHVRANVQMFVEQKFARSSSQPEPDILALRGARIAYSSEASSRMALDQAKIKDMTGGGYISARGIQDKYMTEWKQSALLLLLTNYLPKLDTDDDGFKARTLCIEWPVKFVQNPTKPWERPIDYNISEKILQERSGILARLVRGCMDVLRDGLQVPEKVLRYTQEQIDSFDDIGRFLKECCLIEEPPTGGRQYQTRIKVSDFVKLCNWWCKKVLGNAYPFSPKKLTPALEKKGIPTYKSSVIFYLGVSIKAEILDEYERDQRGED